MKQLKIALLIILLLSAVQSKTAAHKEVRVTDSNGKITITYGNRQTSVTKEQLQLSSTLKNVLSDCSDTTSDCSDKTHEVIQSILTADNSASNAHIISVLELLPHVATIHALPSKEEKDAAQSKLTEQLKQRTTEELIDLMRTANYLDIQTPIDTTAQIIADRLSTSEALADFQKNKEAFLKPFEELPTEMQVAISKHILPHRKELSLKHKVIKVFSTWDTPTISPNEQLIAHDMDTLSDFRPHIYNTQTGRHLYTVVGCSPAFSPDGELIVTAADNNRYQSHIYNAQNGEPLYTVIGRSAEFSPDGKKLITTTTDNLSHIYNPNTGELQHSVVGRFLEFSPDGKRLITTTTDNNRHQSHIYNAQNKDPLHTVAGGFARFSPDGIKVITTTTDNHRYQSHIYNAQNGDPLHTVAGHSPRFSPDGQLIVTKHLNGQFLIYNTTTGKHLYTITGIQSQFSPDGQLIVTDNLNLNDEFLVYNAKTGNLLHSIAGIRPEFSPDGQLIVTHDFHDKLSHIYFTKTGQLLHVIAGRNPKFSPKGTIIATRVDDDTHIYQTASILKLKKAFTRQSITSTMNLLCYLAMKNKLTYIMSTQHHKLFKTVPKEIRTHLKKPTIWWQQLLQKSTWNDNCTWNAIAITLVIVITLDLFRIL